MSTIQKSFKVMFNVPYETHRYFYEALSQTQHAELLIKRRFLNFIRMISCSHKETPKRLLNIIMYDARSYTGANLRTLMLDYGVFYIEDLAIDKEQRLYPVPDEDTWRVGMASEVLDALHGDALVNEFDLEMLNTLISHICRN